MLVIDLPQLVDALPPAPPDELDAALDAAERCFTRHGVTRTSMNDIARAARVSRSTIYRQLGSTTQAMRLLIARETHRLVHGHLPTRSPTPTGPETVLVLMEEVVDYTRRHPVLRKVLADEPEIIGPFLVTELPAATAQVAALVEPIVAAAMDAGIVARQDPAVLGGMARAHRCGPRARPARRTAAPAARPTPAPGAEPVSPACSGAAPPDPIVVRLPGGRAADRSRVAP